MPGTNKVEIKKAIEEIFNVNVVSVNIVNVRRKSRKVGKYSGFRPAVRKANRYFRSRANTRRIRSLVV